MKLAILGTGMIVQTVLPVFKEMDDFELSLLYARPHSLEKGLSLAEQYGIDQVSTDLEEVYRSNCDVVYIGLANVAHYRVAKACLLSNHSVILEKPVTTHASEFRDLVKIAQNKGLFLFEAITTRHLPNFQTLKEKVADLGPIHGVIANYSQHSSRYDRYLKGEILPVFDPDLAGGALYDINIYNIHGVVGLFGAPRSVTYHATFGHNGVDIDGTLILDYGHFVATCIGSKDCDGPNGFVVQGEKGYLEVDGAINECRGWRQKNEKSFRSDQTHQHRMRYEMEAFVRVMTEKRYRLMDEWNELSMIVMAIVDAALASQGLPKSLCLC